MSRKDFLVLIGMFMLSITGIKAAIEVFDDSPRQKRKETSFGTGSYGV